MVGTEVEGRSTFDYVPFCTAFFFPLFSFYLGHVLSLKIKSLHHHQFSLKPFPLGSVFLIRWLLPCLPGGVGFEMLNNSWWSSEWNRIQSAFYLHGNCIPRKFHVHKHCAKNVLSLWVKQSWVFNSDNEKQLFHLYGCLVGSSKVMKDAGQSGALQLCSVLALPIKCQWSPAVPVGPLPPNFQNGL